MVIPDFHIPDAVPPGSGGDGDINLDPEALDDLKAALSKAATALETNRFEDVQLEGNAFGASSSGQELTAEHATAHAIVADTIRGVVADLWSYRDGVVQFESGMGSADDTAAEDLRAREAAVDALTSSATSSQGDANYHESQVNHLPPGHRYRGPDAPGVAQPADGGGEG